jgi:hypothetical protein
MQLDDSTTVPDHKDRYSARLDRAGHPGRREAPVRLLDETVNLEHVGLLQSPFATHITYRIVS